MSAPSLPSFRVNKGEYDVYKNDLKFKKDRNIDQNRARWSEKDYKEMYNTIDFDSLEYRLLEFLKSGKSGYENLDLSQMELNLFPNLIKLHSLQYTNMKYLFIAENNLTELPDLSNYVNIQAIDVSHNKLIKINKLPSSLIELNCKYNHLTTLPPVETIPNIVRLDCAYNKLKEIPIYKKLGNLICGHNEISVINNYTNLERIICNDNKIVKIENLNNVKYLDCCNNDIKELPMNMINLIDLIINDTKIEHLPDLEKIKYIEMFGVNINYLNYFDTLEDLFCYKDSIYKLSKKYTENKKITVKPHKDKILHISFELKD